MQQLAAMYSPLGSLLENYCKTSDYYDSEKTQELVKDQSYV